MQTSNEESVKIVPRALIAMGVSDGQAKLWPGTEFTAGAENEAEREAADALIGGCTENPLDKSPTDCRMTRLSKWSSSRLLYVATQATTRWRKVHLEVDRVQIRG